MAIFHSVHIGWASTDHRDAATNDTLSSRVNEFIIWRDFCLFLANFFTDDIQIYIAMNLRSPRTERKGLGEVILKKNW